MNYRIAPSILYAEFAHPGDDLRAEIAAGADALVAESATLFFGSRDRRAVMAGMRGALERRHEPH